MSEPTPSTANAKFLSRIGTWFRRGERPGQRPAAEPRFEIPEGAFDTLTDDADTLMVNGEDGAGEALTASDTALAAGHAEPRSTFLRPWAKRDQAIENLQSGLGALADLMGGIREHLEKQSRRQEDMLQYLSHLPDALKALPEGSRVQGETLKAIHQQMERQTHQQSKLADILDRLSTADNQQHRTLEALQEHVDGLHQQDEAISHNLIHVGSVMENLGRNAQANTQVLQQMRDNSTTREGELERVLQRQDHRFTSMFALALTLSVAALAAVGVIGYLSVEAMRAAY